MENDAEVPAGQRAGRDRKGKAQKGTLKQRGELAEMGFMFKAAGLGFGVAKPWGDSERYDYILDSGKRLWRVQVKSTYAERGHSYRVHACADTAGKKRPYTAKQIDFLVGIHCRGRLVVCDSGWGLCAADHAEAVPPGSKSEGASKGIAKRGI